MSPDAPYRIMIINGSQEMLQLLGELIEEFGEGQYSCKLQALDDAYHVERIREVRPHLVLIDQPFHDPKLEGWELVQKIRLARDLKETPIIFTTTNVQLLHELDAQLAVLNVRAILKPFDPDALMLQLRSALADAGQPSNAPSQTQKQDK